MNLSDAQDARRARGEQIGGARTERLLNLVGLSEQEVLQLGTADVSPAARKKLEPILNRLRTKAHKFTTCMNDLRKNHPEWSEDRRKKTCNVLKALAGGNSGGSTKASLSLSQEGACVMVDDDVAALLERVDEEVLEVFLTAEEHGLDMAVLTAKQRKNLPPTSFVFAKGKRYPIHDLAHARNALARSSGKPEEAAVKAAVYRKFPQLKPKSSKKAAA